MITPPITPNLTLDTSCIIPLLHLPDDFTHQGEITALEKLQKAHAAKRLAIWISKKSVNESLVNLEESTLDESRNKKWLDTLEFFSVYNKTASILVLGISRLDYDAVLASDDQSEQFEKIKQIIKGNKRNLSQGDVYDITILYEHHLQGNDLFVTLDEKIFRKTVIKRLYTDFGIRIVTPIQAILILESQYKIVFD